MITSIDRGAIETPTCNEEADIGHETAAFCLELSLLTCTLLNSYLNKVAIMEKKLRRTSLYTTRFKEPLITLG